jgi:hypothetical protein
MMKPSVISIVLTTILLLVLTILTSVGILISLAFLIFSFSPVAVMTMVYFILKDKGYKGRELRENEEWAYQDKEF